MVDITAYEEFVLPAYKRQYPDLKGTRITEIVQDVFGGDLVVVRSDNEVPHEEITFVYPDHRVRIFYSTEELVRFLESASNRSFLDRFFARPILSGVVFFGLLIVISLAGINQLDYSDKVLTILGNVVALAAGFFFGSNRPTGA